MNTMGMITIAKFLEEHNASVNLMNLFEAMCSDFIKLQQETNAAQEKNIEAQHSGSVEVKPDSQQTKVANCHLWEVGKQCEYVVGWVCLNQCCAIPPISNRL